MINIYTQIEPAQEWISQYRQKKPLFACILGFTATGLIPGISAAGATPSDRQYTALADAEFLINGVTHNPQYPLPPLDVGISPVFISRAVLQYLQIPVYLFNSGLHTIPTVPSIDLEGCAANCLSTGQALSLEIVNKLFTNGWKWGEKLAQQTDYLIIGECVVGGTTTALAILTGLGIEAKGKVNSSHPCCNHSQKWEVVGTGLTKSGLFPVAKSVNPMALVAAVGDPMQISAAGMALAASQKIGVILAGGTQMLAVYALMRSLSEYLNLRAKLENIVVGTTRWVACDPTGDTIGLAHSIGGVPLLATSLNFTNSVYPSLRAYEQGFVKEGVGAGGCAIAAHLLDNWSSVDLVRAIEALILEYLSYS